MCKFLAPQIFLIHHNPDKCSEYLAPRLGIHIDFFREKSYNINEWVQARMCGVFFPVQHADQLEHELGDDTALVLGPGEALHPIDLHKSELPVQFVQGVHLHVQQWVVQTQGKCLEQRHFHIPVFGHAQQLQGLESELRNVLGLPAPAQAPKYQLVNHLHTVELQVLHKADRGDVVGRVRRVENLLEDLEELLGGQTGAAVLAEVREDRPLYVNYTEVV